MAFRLRNLGGQWMNLMDLGALPGLGDEIFDSPLPQLAGKLPLALFGNFPGRGQGTARQKDDGPGRLGFALERDRRGGFIGFRNLNRGLGDQGFRGKNGLDNRLSREIPRGIFRPCLRDRNLAGLPRRYLWMGRRRNRIFPKGSRQNRSGTGLNFPSGNNGLARIRPRRRD